MKEVEKTTRPLRYDLIQIPCGYTSGSDKKIQGIKSDRVSKELWMEVCNNVQELVIKLSPRKKKNAKKTEWLSEETLQIVGKRKKDKKREDISM